MAARGLQVFVNIGAKVSSSVGASVRAVGGQLQGLARRVQLANAEAKAASRGLMTSGDIRGAIFDSVAIGYGLYRAAKPFVDFEDQLVRVGNTAQVYGDRLKAGGAATLNAGKMYGFGAEAALTGLNDFISAGVRGKDGKGNLLDTFDTALQSLPKTLQLAKTAGIEVGEASQSAIAVVQNLGVGVGDLGKAFDAMAAAGKEGRFELNDMAKEFPSLTSYASQLGMKGLDGVQRLSAMLQITRMNARDSEEAANNLVNFFQKATGKETTQHFAKMGVNLEKVWKKAKASGTDYVDALLDEIAKLSKNGEDTFVLNKLFPDRQANQAVTALIKNRQEYERIRGAVKNAAGVLDADWNRVSKTAKSSTDRLFASLKSIAITFGAAVGPSIADAAEKLAKLSGDFALFAEKNPEIVKAVAELVGALGGLLIVGKIGSIIYTGVARVAIALKWVWDIVKIFGGSAAARGIILFFTDLAAIAGWAGLGAVATTVALVAAAIALLAAGIGWVVAKWEGIKAFFRGFAEGFMNALSPEVRKNIEDFGAVLKGFGDYMSALGDLIGGILSNKFNDLMQWFKDLYTLVFGPPKTDNWKAFGQELGEGLAGAINKIERLINLIGTLRKVLGGNIAAMIGGPGVTAGQAPGSTAGAAAGAAIAGARQPSNASDLFSGKRAAGGPVRRGHTYQINEKGQELFAPGTNGQIITARATAALMAAANNNSPQGGGGNMSIGAIHIHGANDPQSTRRIVREEFQRLAKGQRAALND